jgi:hypothetical protein
MRRALLIVLAACAGESAPPAPWTTCEGHVPATEESLHAKAEAYEARLVGLHVTQQHPWVLDVAIAPGADPEAATAADVTAWRSGENDGLWTGLAIGAEAYRFAATHEPAARDALAQLLAGERLRMQITGVPGLFTRQLIPPGIAGLACPDDPALYVPSETKTANRWVRIGSDGCAQTADASGAFHSTSHCGLDAFARWCFLDNISQDEYVGHLFGLGAVMRLVDDPDLRATAQDLLDQIGAHLLAHDMEFVDWDGRATQWGKVHPGAGGDSPGYLAVLGSAFLATTGRPSAQLGFTSYFDQITIWNGPDGCTSNWNDISMLAASFHDLIAAERDPDVAARFTATLVDHPRGITSQHDAWYDLLWVLADPDAARREPAAYAAVDDAICQLREFPRSNQVSAHEPGALAPEVCTGRHDESLAATPAGVADRCAATFVWWGNPYDRAPCTADPTLIQQPTGYLLPYWMARQAGIITAEQ